MIDKSWIGKSLPALTVDVEKGQLKFFAKSVGEKNPLYTDEEVARVAGYRALPAPPTFCFSLSLASPNPLAKYALMDIDTKRVLHGGESFEYFVPVCAGDTITLETSVVDIYEKKGGVLEFLKEETVATNQHGEVVAKLFSTLVIRH
jgi:acyl dehydratase